MEFLVHRRIRDNLHGSVDISDIENKVISHPYFQRLRRIKQTAFLSLVFPGATHTRFEHSIGSMYLSGIAWNKIIENQKRLRKSTSFLCSTEKIDDALLKTFEGNLLTDPPDYLYQVIRLAALMHDVGHSPFSHSGERFMPNLETFCSQNKEVADYLKDFFNKRNQDPKKSSEKVRHEFYSILIIEHIINDINKSLDNKEYFIDPRDVICVLNPEIKPSTNSIISKYRVQYLINELISGEIDVDRMDYLLRDSKECGVVYGLFDVDRIMDSLVFYHKEEDSCFHLGIRMSGLSAFEDYLRARQSMYVQLYFHKTSVACEAMLSEIDQRLKTWRLPADYNDFVSLDDNLMVPTLKKFLKESASKKTICDKVELTINNLFLERKIWKRVYEVTSHDNSNTPHEIELVSSYLERKKIPFQLISTKSNLTNYDCQNKKQKNFLKLIKKDLYQNYVLAEIKNHSKLYKDSSIVKIFRIYVDQQDLMKNQLIDLKKDLIEVVVKEI